MVWLTTIWVETDIDGDVHLKTIIENVQFQLDRWAWIMENYIQGRYS